MCSKSNTRNLRQVLGLNLIGRRGYPAPTNEFRWCTDRLKIDPTNKFVIETASKYGEVIVVLGVRKAGREVINREKEPSKGTQNRKL
ncbi:MAG: hypothetical protein Q9M89_09620 [Persephonella sp.]|nr:hypothetical protein [Persephonella sp.]